jgi:hypothetical protein
VNNWFKEPLVNDHSIMGRPTPESGGGTPQNQGLSEFKPSAKERGVGWGVKKPEEPNQQTLTPDRTLYERFHRERGRRQTGIAGGEAHNETYRRLERIRHLDDSDDKE